MKPNMSTSSLDGHNYDRLFYEYQREGSLRSALALLPLVLDAFPVRSVLDIGCGAGAWLAAYEQLGVFDIVGVDGDYVDRSVLMVEPSRFRSSNITHHFDLGRRFDLVQCLEVAEHVPQDKSDLLVDNIVRHSSMVLFSAAVPGQGGEDHINEQPYSFWRDRFAARGYRLFDFVRPQVKRCLEIEPWYRYNVMLFVDDTRVASLPPSVIRTRVHDVSPVPDVSPLSYKMRKSLLRCLPVPLVSTLAVWNARRVVKLRRAQ